MIVAIDGPAGAGKSTVARAVAQRLGFVYLDTGALYRAITAAALDAGLSPSDEAGLAGLAGEVDMEVASGKVSVAGRELTHRLRDLDVTAAVSEVAAHPRVRAALIPVQRSCAAAGDTVVEGRDIGTAVFPDAQIKVFLTADPRERARRRALEIGAHDEAGLEGVERGIVERDLADSTRATSPLAQPVDAVVVDTSDMDFAAVVEHVAGLVDAGRSGP